MNIFYPYLDLRVEMFLSESHRRRGIVHKAESSLDTNIMYQPWDDLFIQLGVATELAMSLSEL
jgi:hypothetical protein